MRAAAATPPRAFLIKSQAAGRTCLIDDYGRARTSGREPSSRRTHAHNSLRRNCLRHAAVRARVGLSVTLGLMNFINLAHGSFAMAGGYVTVILMNRLGVPFFACVADRVSRQRGHRRAARTHALCPCLPQAAPRPGAVLDRPRLHVGGGGRLCRGLEPADRADSRPACKANSISRHRHRPLPAAHHRSLRPADDRAAIDPRQDALRQPAARRGRRQPRGARARHQRQPDLLAHLRRRLAAWPGSAARSAPRCSGSIRPSRSSS